MADLTVPGLRQALDNLLQRGAGAGCPVFPAEGGEKALMFLVGGAYVRASVFRLERDLTSDEMGVDCRSIFSPAADACGAEEG